MKAKLMFVAVVFAAACGRAPAERASANGRAAAQNAAPEEGMMSAQSFAGDVDLGLDGTELGLARLELAVRRAVIADYARSADYGQGNRRFFGCNVDAGARRSHYSCDDAFSMRSREVNGSRMSFVIDAAAELD